MEQDKTLMPKISPAVSTAAPPVVDCILFDMDNVLVDTRYSYLDAIRWTVEIFLTHGKIPFFQFQKKSRTPQILTPKDVDQFKLLGGFNDDWDCCYGILNYLLSLPVPSVRGEDLKAAMDIEKFAASVQKRPLRVQGIVDLLGRKNAVTIERISKIFQEVYLGHEITKIMHKRKALYWKKKGLIYKEKPIFKKRELEALKRTGIKLGIATGRSRFEAGYALKRFGIYELFDTITTMDEVKKAEKEQKRSLRKPHPFSLLETAKKLGKNKRFFYVGDLPDDVYATEQARAEINIRSVAFPSFASHPEFAAEELKRAKPDFFITKTRELLKIAGAAKE